MTETQNNTSASGTFIINEATSKDAKWYVVHTYSGHELKVAKLLEQTILSLGKKDYFFKVMVPQKQKVVVTEGKKRKVDEKLYPGYLLINMIINDATWHLVRSARGVTGFVGTGANPTPLPESEVKALVSYINTEETKFETKFAIGDSVKITDGPFSDSLGKIDEVNEDQGKLKVLVNMFGRETPVELDFVQVSSI